MKDGEIFLIKEYLKKLKITVREDEETGIWVSYNPDLDLHSQGLTEKEAIEALKLGIETHLSLCHERGIYVNKYNSNKYNSRIG